MDNTRKELLQTIGEKMTSVIRRVHTSHGIKAGESTLRPPQVHVLFCIAKNKGELAVKDLAEMLNVTPGAITQFVDGLVEMHLLKREEDTKDRRIIRVKLTDLAEGKLEELRKGYLASLSQLFDLLSDEEIKQLIMLLSKVNLPSDTRRVTPGGSSG